MRTLSFKNSPNRASAVHFIFWAFILVLLAGCAYGKLRTSDVKLDRIPEFLDENYDRFIVSYSGEEGTPAAIRFDLKDDSVTLTGAGWTPVEDRDALHRMMDSMIARYRFWEGIFRGPYLLEILSTDGTRIGYYYSILEYTTIRPDGPNYSMDPVTDLEIREKLRYPSVRGAGG